MYFGREPTDASARRSVPDRQHRQDIVVAPLTDRHYAGMLAVRTGIAGFVQLSEREARQAGTTHAQHHVMLALRGRPDEDGPAAPPSVKDIATALGIASPSAVELVARMVGAGLLRRQEDADDRRVTRLRLTELGEKLLRQLSEAHLPRLRELHRKNVELLSD